MCLSRNVVVKKLITHFIYFYIGFLLVAITAGNLDFVQVRDNGKPLIGNFPTGHYADGGTRVWAGPGYRIQKLHRITPGVGEAPGRTYFEAGPVLEPWPMLSIPGFRKFLIRQSVGVIYYNDSEVKYIIYPSEENWIIESIFEAINELLPYALFFFVFWIYWLVVNRQNHKRQQTGARNGE